MTAAAAAERPPDDAELARRIGQRDERAFETLMRAHNRLLYRLARSILKDDAEAEDAVQEAYLAA
ncbi:MAG: RNA polymerase subunit sigma, partial [Betaproteobacteria bacterium]